MTDQALLDYFHARCGPYITKTRVKKLLVMTGGTLMSRKITSESFSDEVIQEIVDEKRPPQRNALIIRALHKANDST